MFLHAMTQTGKGFAAATAAFAIWGAFPLYFHPLYDVPALQVIAHRVLWSCAFVLSCLALRHELPALRSALADRSVLLRLTVSAALITVNWTVYVWAVTHGHVLEASLGYFINPLVNVLLGVLLLAERLNRPQWIAIVLATLGVIYLAVVAGSPPWIALALAISFGTYGLVRKVVRVESLAGLAVETLILLPFALLYLAWCESSGIGGFGSGGPAIRALLVGSGPLTAIALFLFAYGARLLPYSTVGVLTYLAPSLQFACAVFAFHEPFERARAVGFVLIWIALVIYVGEGWLRSRRAHTIQSGSASAGERSHTDAGS
jgi:chloramphenicol-sensitive protein RarD